MSGLARVLAAMALLLAGCGNGAAVGQAYFIQVSGPDKYGVVCYRSFMGISCVQVKKHGSEE